ncbi:MFS transporter-17 [Coleophoma crateriformis]|uniref:MFS transporter-17 n=1 Tax=Coleophoma crateriformis TaxID=565419 RepID=A0A3D8RW48_9HELO|nr:MFS transporter-17 [Coleophoma crateriformis]
MGLGVLQDRVMDHVPGTTRYFDDPDRPQAATAHSAGLKCDTSGAVPIILVPQPSDDPNDPLNWPLWKRDSILLILSLVSVFATALGPILAANTLTLSLYFERTFTAVALLTGYFLLGVGVAGVLCVPSARIWGKRHLFLCGTVLLIGSSAWGGASRSYKSLLWARIFQGVATAPFEALVNVTVGDLYFVHERGKRMALTNLAVFGGAFFTPILVGKITHTIGWPWSFYFVAIFLGACLPFVILFVPETAYRRSSHLNTDMAASDVEQYSKDERGFGLHTIGSDGDGPTATQEVSGVQSRKIPTTTENQEPMNDDAQGVSTPKQSYKQSLMPFNGRKSDETFLKLFLRPFPLFAHPAILWACLIQGTLIGWTVFIGIILAAIFLGPPLFWNEVSDGYSYTGAFVGAILGFLLAGGLADWSAKYMTRKNGGIYEPEFRIVLVLPQMIIGGAGLYGFGITAAQVTKFGWFWPVFFFALEVMGMVIGAVASSLYIVDAHRDIAIEAFTCMIMFKNFFSFGLTWSAYGWLVHSGTYKVFMVISSVQIIVCLLSVPMYMFGKRNRSFFHRHNLLKMTGLD